jgi:hypothetical protein
MNLESFDDFSEWFKTNKYVLVAEPAFDAEASKIKLKCLHCKQDPFTVFPVKKGGWNIGIFTRHLNADKLCSEQVSEAAALLMDTSDTVSMTLHVMTLFTLN